LFIHLLNSSNVLISFPISILLSKAKARYLDMLSNDFPIHRGVKQNR